MGLRQCVQTICQLDHKFAWSFTGVVLAILFGGMAIYGQFFSDLNPRLKYEILTNAPVIDVHEDITKLSVLFDGIDIRKQKESLRVMTIRAVNDSGKDILKGYYDQNDPLGLSISGGKIIRADLLGASSPYLEKHLQLRQPNDATVFFPDVILEAGEFFTIKVLLLHPEATEPGIHPIGKIAGIRNVPVSESYGLEPAPSFFRLAFAGDILIQCFRLVSYGILMIGVVIGGLATAVAADTKVGPWRVGRARSRLLKDFKRQTKIAVLPDEELILRDIVADWGSYQKESLPSLLSLISDSSALESNYVLGMQERKEAKAREDAEAAQKRMEEEKRARVKQESPKLSPAEELAAVFRFEIPYYVKRGLILETAKGPALNKHMLDTLVAFAGFLKKKGYLRKPSDATAE